MPGKNTYVLEFSLGERRYCIDISHVEEIVDADEEITPVPNAAAEVVGVVDLRGETTTIVDPKVSLDLDAAAEGRRIIVLSDIEGTGLLIDDVHQVVEVTEADLDDSTAAESTHGVIRHDDRFVVWIDPAALV
jgi:purine-binding chemotaxis protein CheW